MDGEATGHDRGHTVLDHTADAVIEAWGPDQASCYEEAVTAFIALFVDLDERQPTDERTVEVGPGRPADLLVLLLEEVLLDFETGDCVPSAARVEIREDRLVATFATVPVAELAISGAIPKGISYSDLDCGPTGGRWRCRLIIDV